jgi:Domain of unknown function (DUF4129)
MRSILTILCGAVVLLAAGQGAAGTPLSAAEYVRQLQELRQSLNPEASAAQAEKLAAALPEEWIIDAQGRRFTVSTATVVSDLRNYAKKPAAGKLDAVRAEIDLLVSDASAMVADRADFSGDRAKLTAILGRPEFHRVHGETWLDRLKRQAQELLARLFGRLLTSSVFPVASRIVVWSLVVLAVALLGLWLVRIYRESNVYTNISGVPGAISEKPWRDWKAEALIAAEQERWRDAIHLYYWAAISFLEAQGLWRPDRGRTPREYLRLLPRGNTHSVPLTELTRNFETVWYGDEPANEQKALAARALLESVGCR